MPVVQGQGVEPCPFPIGYCQWGPMYEIAPGKNKPQPYVPLRRGPPEGRKAVEPDDDRIARTGVSSTACTVRANLK
jgi:hypothetical protein